MVESIGAKPVTGSQGVVRVAAAKPVAAVAQPTATDTSASQVGAKAATAGATALSGVAKQLASSPPVDTDRVSKIKKAIAEGKFPLLPTTIADRLLALKLQWDGNEQA